MRHDGIDERVAARVLARDNEACSVCGLAPGDRDPYDADVPVRLLIEPFLDRPARPGDGPDDLRVVCHVCSDGLKGLDRPPPTPFPDLMRDLRRATVADQRRALDWLARKFERGQV